MSISNSEIALGKVLKEDFVKYARACLKIRAKSGEIKDLELNTAQLYIHGIAEEQKKRTGRVRIITCKGRQEGISTYIEGRFYWLTTHRKGFKAFILTHHTDATQNLFGMAQRYHENCPDPFRPHSGANNANELNFDRLDSGYAVGTAGNKAVGRSDTIQLLHSSEVAYQPNSEMHASGLLQTVPRENDTEIWLESTSNGPGDYFHQQWQMAIRGESEFIAVFIPWFWQTEYKIEGPFEPRRDELEIKELYGLTNEQLHWRRMKIQEMGGTELGLGKFKRDYPNSPDEAFEDAGENKVIPAKTIRSAVGRDVVSILTYRPIWGLDVGGGGDKADRSALSKRQANTLLEPTKFWQGKDPMQVAGLIMWEYQHTPVKPAKIYVDSIGIGAGVVSRLLEHPSMKGVVVGINVSENDAVSETCWKMRDELWWRSRLWFEGANVKMPEGCEALIQELATPTYQPNSAGKVVVESKKDMAKRGVRSVDLADSFNLTFSGPEILFESISPHGSHTVNYDPFSKQHIKDDFNPKHQVEWTPARY